MQRHGRRRKAGVGRSSKPALSALSSSVSVRLSPFLAVRSSSVRHAEQVVVPRKACFIPRAHMYLWEGRQICAYLLLFSSLCHHHGQPARARDAHSGERGCACSAERGAVRRMLLAEVYVVGGEVTVALRPSLFAWALTGRAYYAVG